MSLNFDKKIIGKDLIEIYFLNSDIFLSDIRAQRPFIGNTLVSALPSPFLRKTFPHKIILKPFLRLNPILTSIL